MASTAGPQDVMDAAEGARRLLSEIPSRTSSGASRGEWCAALSALQAVVDVATAVQDEGIAALAALEPEWAEDGTLIEVLEPFGHVALDAPAILSGALRLGAVAADRRVRHAVRLTADGASGGDAPASGLGGLHAAMRHGRLDAYRAQVVAGELEEVPPGVAEAVVAAIDPWFECEAAPVLRRRVRRMLARISPDLLRRRAVRARAESSLQRWVDEPGTDTWHGTFPSEDACTAWAAIDALAQQYVADGTCERVDRARAKALTDLVTGNATIDVHVVLTTAAVDQVAPPSHVAPGAPTDLVEVTGVRPGGLVFVPRGWLDRAVEQIVGVGRDRLGRPLILPCDSVTGAPVDPTGDLTGSGYRPGARLAAFVRARDGHCRFPGCHIAARFCDLDHVRPFPLGPTSAATSSASAAGTIGSSNGPVGESRSTPMHR